MVVLDVQVATSATHVLSGAYWGGFKVSASVGDLGRDVLAKVCKICNWQIKALAWLKENGERNMGALGVCEKEVHALVRLFSGGNKEVLNVDDIEAELDGTFADSTVKLIETGQAQMWWIKKAFDLDAPLSDRAGKNEKSTLKVFVTDTEEKPTENAETEKLQKSCMLFVDAARKSGKKSCSEIQEQERLSTKRKKVEHTMARLAKYRKRAEEEGEDEEEDWVLPKEKLSLLDHNEKVQRCLNDANLLAVLIEVDSAKDPYKALQEKIDSDCRFESFVDLLLETIGAQKRVEVDGMSHIQSCIRDVIEKKRPSFEVQLSDEGSDEEEEAS